MPRRTSARIAFGLEDVSAKRDSLLSVSSAQPFSNVEQTEQDGLVFEKYATLEHNFWSLDGSSKILPDDTAGTAVGWWSAEMSDGDGVFALPPVLTAAFSQRHSSIGLTFTFCHGAWPTALNIKWYDGDTLLAEQTDRPASETHAVMRGVENYTKLVVTFLNTNHPFRYLKLTGIQYGITQIFDQGALISASVREEINPLSEELSINTIHFKLHSADAAFSILNPQGIFTFLQQKQALAAWETVDGEIRPMGTFYLDEWSGENENTFTMSDVDAIGIMDGTQYMGGIYEGISAGALIADIMESAGFRYELDGGLSEERLTGWLPAGTHREALQQAAFALCAVVDDSRGDILRIYPADYAPQGVIRRTRKFNGGALALKQFVTGVEVLEHNYAKADTAGVSTLFEGVLPAGENTIKFNSPSYDISVSGAALRMQHANYAVLDVDAEQNVVVTGRHYTDTTRVVGKYMAVLPAGQKQSVLTVNDATLVSRANAQRVAENIYNYHQKRVQQNFTFLLDGEEAGKSYAVETLYGQSKDGMIEAMDINLTGGYLAKVTVTGE